MSHKLDETFDVIPVIEGEVMGSGSASVPAITSSPLIEENADTDYETARSNLHTLLQQGQSVLGIALKLVEQSETAHSIEVAGSFIKQLAEINGQLLDLSLKRSRIQTKEAADSGDKTVNAYFVGSTTELNELLKQTQKDLK